jgi:hypothetical protein
MAQEVEVKIKVDTSQAVSGVNKLEQGLKGATTQSTALGNTMQGSKQSEFINQLGDGVGKLNPAFGSAVKGANGLILKMWEMVANPVGAILAGIVVTAKFLYEAFQDSIAGGKELKAAFAALSAVGATVKSAMFELGRSLINVTTAAYKFITLDFKGAAEDFKKAGQEAANAQNHLGDAVDGTTAKVIQSLTKRQQANDKAAKLQAVTQANTDKLLVKSKEILTDELSTFEQKKKALAEVTAAENKSAKEKLRIAQENLNIKLDEQKLYGATTEMGKKMGQELRDLTIERDHAEQENSQTGFKLSKQKKMLNRQEISDEKEKAAAKKQIGIEQAAAAKIAYDADKTALDEKLKEEGLTFQQRRDLIKADLILKDEDRKKLNDQINKEEKKAVEDHNKAIADLNKKYDDEKANRLADTAVKKEELDYQRQVAEIDKVVQSKVERDTLIEKLDAEHLARMATAQKTDADKIREEKLAQIKTDLENDDISFEAKKQLILDRENLLLQNQKLTESQKTQIHKESVDAQMKIDDLQLQAKKNQLAGIGDALAQASAMAGESTAVGKTLAVASATISTYSSAQKAYESAFLPVPTTASPILGNIFRGVAIASGLMNIKKILSVKTPSGGGGGIAMPSATSISTPTAINPAINVVGASSTNAIADTIARQGQQPIKTYVVANDVTTQQALSRSIVESASIG